jgi:hypothetical protein
MSISALTWFNKAYKYEPLEDGHVRLLRLLPAAERGRLGGIFSSDILCEVFHVPLEEAEHYDALSYAWGSQKRNFHIQIGTRGLGLNPTIAVTLNLITALKRLRHSQETRVLWIDQVCIDQSNVEERERQVSRMRDIYSGADAAVVWLGDHDYDTKLLESMYKELSALPSVTENRGGVLMLDQSALRKMMDMGSIGDGLSRNRRDLLERFLNRAWFRRAWVYQEAVVAPRVEMVWGYLALPFDFVTGLIMSVYSIAKSEEGGEWHMRLKQTKGFGPLRAIFYDRQAYRENKMDFLNILWHARKYLEATDHRDFVYSFLGFYEPNDWDIEKMAKLRISPDYSVKELTDPKYKSAVEKAFTKLAYTLIQNSGSLDILQLVVPTKKSTYRLPSWVPSWSEKSFISGSPIVLRDNTRRFDACRNKCHSPKRPAGSNMMELHAQGHVLGTVDIVMDSEITHTYFASTLAEAIPLNELVRSVRQYVATSVNGPEKNNEPTWLEHQAREVVLQTLLADGSFSPEGKIVHTMQDLLGAYYQEGDATNQTAEGYKLRQYIRQAGEIASGKRAFMTDNLDIGLGYCTIKRGDTVCILYGCNAPCVIRPSHRLPGHYKFVGQCYIHEWMNGDTKPRSWEWWNEEPQEFVLV